MKGLTLREEIVIRYSSTTQLGLNPGLLGSRTYTVPKKSCGFLHKLESTFWSLKETVLKMKEGSASYSV